ncbi:restriction endonuclease subunit S [Mesomycoplasma hyorhinis]|uniref:restriction endonuclease subunit S n=1 Tax=Mesomycoplasma hyorhinis TaxID=2100 RepID=UPI003DA2A862
MKKVLKPEIRFKGFTDAWIQCKVGELFELDGGGFVSKYEIQNNPGKYPVYSSQTTNNGTMGYISSYKYDLECLTWTTRGYAGVVFYRNEKFSVSNSGLLIFKRNIIYNYRYFLFVFQMADIQKSMTVGNIPQFTVEMMKEAVLTYSNNLNEQRKISQLFYTLDKIVSLYERKISLLEKIKKSFLESMFTKENEAKPSIRFNLFSDIWKSIKLSDFGFFKGSTVDKVIRNQEHKVAMLNYMDVFTKKEIKYSNLKKNSATKEQIKNFNILENDVFLTPSSETAEDIGKFSTSAKTIKDAVYSYHLVRYRAYTKIFSTYYLDYAFLNSNNKSVLTKNAQGAQRYTLSLAFLNELSLKAPKIQEQDKISTFFTKVDLTHAQLKRKLNLIKNIQKSVLNKMFV